MKSRTKIIAAALVVLLVVGVAVFLWSYLLTNRLSIQFYKDGEPVGLPVSIVPLKWVSSAGQEVDSFTVTASWYTDNPTISYVEVPVHLKIVYSVGRGEQVVYDAHLWTATGSVGPDHTGSRTSGLFALDLLAAGVPEDTAFSLYFSGDANFYTGNPEHGTETLIATVPVTPAAVQAYRTAYTYSATLDVGW
jgi:hypothetical protein